MYARSREKLLEAHPILAKENSQHEIFTGNLDDVGLFSRCISGADAVYGVVGTNANKPGLRLAQDLAEVIAAALAKLKDESRADESFECPTVIFITSAGMTRDPRVRANFPAYLHWILQRVGKYIYEDFRHATAFLQKPENAWIPVIFFCAPGLIDGLSQGNVSIGVDIPKNAPIYVTYTDLARGMIQSAAEAESWANKEIGIIGTKMPPVDYGVMMWRFGHKRGWWGEK